MEGIKMNRIRGEAELIASGKSHRLLLTLGALAEIEDGLSLANLAEIGPRLKQMRAADLAIVAAALLRGGGHDVTPADVLRLPCVLSEVARAVADAFAFAGVTEPDAATARGEGTPVPFVGSASSRSPSAS
jgi:hypothetical protein